jgi:hypothetical protein
MMADYGDYAPQVTPDALPGRPWPHLPDEVSPESTGAEVGQGIEDVGEVMGHHAAVAEDQARITQAQNAENQLQALTLKTTHDPQTGALTKQGQNAFGLTGQYMPGWDSAAQQIVDSVPDPRARLAVQAAAGHMRGGLIEQLDTHEIDQHNAFAAKTSQDSVDIATQAAAANYNNAGIIAANWDRVNSAITVTGQMQGWSPDQVQEAKYQAGVKFHDGIVQSMLSDQKVGMAQAYFDSVKGQLRPQDAKEFEREIQAGQVTASANSILGLYRTNVAAGGTALASLENSNLTPEQQDAVVRQVEQGRGDLAAMRQQDPAIRQQMTALDGAIASGTTGPGSLAQVDSLWQRGALTDDQRLLLRDQVLRSQKKGNAAQSAFDQAASAYTNRQPLDPKNAGDKKGVNLLFSRATVGAPPGSAAYNNAAAEIAARVGVIPENAISYARASLVGGDPKAAAQGAQLLAALQNANPRAYTEATDPQTRAMAARISSAVGAGTDPEVAVNMAREQRSSADQKLLDTAWNAQRPVGDTWQNLESAVLQKGLEGDPNYTESGLHFGNTVPSIPTPMVAEFNDLTKQYFYHTQGNLQEARQLAMNDLKGTWGVSTVNGQRELMKYAPERMFPGLTAEDIRADLTASGHGDAHLIESPETSTNPRMWYLGEKDKFGAWDVALGKNGQPLRYQLPAPDPKKVEAKERADLQKQYVKLQADNAARQADDDRILWRH